MPPGRVGFVLRGRSVRLIRGLGFKSPFPWGAFYALDDFYLELGVMGAVFFRPMRGGKSEPLYVDYATVKEIVVREQKVVVDGTVVLVAPSAKAADRVRRDFESIRELPEKKRAEAIKKLVAKHLAPAEAVNIRAVDDKILTSVRTLGTCVLAVVCGLIGYLLMGRTERLQAILFAWGMLTFIAIMRFVQAHAKLWPKDRAQRWTRAFTYLHPLALAKSPDVCTHDRMVDLHLLAPMRAFTSAAESGRLIEETLGDARASVQGGTDDVSRTRAEHRATLIAVLEAIAPAPQKKTADNDDGVVVRCPRCGAGYTRQVTECFDCGATIEQAG